MFWERENYTFLLPIVRRTLHILSQAPAPARPNKATVEDGALNGRFPRCLVPRCAAAGVPVSQPVPGGASCARVGGPDDGRRGAERHRRQVEAILTRSLLRVINFNFPVQPHQKYYITQYEELGFSWLTQMQDDYTINSPNLSHTYLLRGWAENVLFELGSERVEESVSTTLFARAKPVAAVFGKPGNPKLGRDV